MVTDNRYWMIKMEYLDNFLDYLRNGNISYSYSDKHIGHILVECYISEFDKYIKVNNKVVLEKLGFEVYM